MIVCVSGKQVLCGAPSTVFFCDSVSSFRCLRFEQKADQVFELRIGKL